MEQPHYVIADPRHDSAPDDSCLWELLMAWCVAEEIVTGAAQSSTSLYSALHGLRCGLARIVVEGATARIVPGEWAPDEYDDLKERYLIPHRALLRDLLTRLGEWWQQAKVDQVGCMERVAAAVEQRMML
jgi:hypothetical protein